ncbi:MAG TPA: glutamate-1-semialdehyde 2,1-aminomutase [Planctomycetota bacterium]
MKKGPLPRSKAAFERARQVIPGGVNSPVRAYRAVGGHPPFIASGKGATVVDLDGNRYLDYVLSWGPLILGHAPKPVVDAVRAAAGKGTSYGAPTAAEVEMAEFLRSAFPSMQKIRLVSSGTEAAMSAIRAARGFTGRDDILKFEGCYHGHSDGLLVKAGSGLATFGEPSSAGVPADVARHTLVLPYNNLEAVRSLVKERGTSIAAVILEPVAGNMGVVPPAPGYLDGLREITKAAGIVLIFDEVISGFRLCWGGAQTVYGVEPDLTCLGKIIGGGLPVGAYGGRREIMEKISPDGPVYQAGTLSGNPLAVAAGLAQLKTLKANRSIYKRIAALAERLEKAFRGVTVNRVGSMLTPFFGPGPVTDWDSAAKADASKFAAFHQGMRERGVLLPPSQWEAMFTSAAHTDKDIERTIRVMREVGVA